MNNKIIVGTLVAVAIIAIGGYFFPTVAPQVLPDFSGITNYDSVTITPTVSGEGLKVGTNGTAIGGIKAGACTIWAGATTIAASTTAQVVCQSATDGSLTSGLTGVTTDAICQLTMASSTNTTSNSLIVAGVSASSTAGSIVARLSNLTGTTFTWTAAASSSSQWNYTCIDPN